MPQAFAGNRQAPGQDQDVSQGFVGVGQDKLQRHANQKRYDAQGKNYPAVNGDCFDLDLVPMVPEV
jgi:hypothetical protein